MSLDGNTGVLAEGARGVELYNLPFAQGYQGKVAAYNTPGFAHHAVRRGDLVYVADGPSGLQILRQDNSVPKLVITGGSKPKIQLTGFVGSFYDIEVTDGLEKGPTSWMPLLTVELTEPSQIIEDIVLPLSQRARFYRARLSW